MKTLSILMLVAIALQLSSCNTKDATPEQPNIVWITSEDNSKHYMELFDKNGITTPNIEKLAQHGITFNNAFSNAAVCSAARSTLISGCYGPRVASHYHRKIKTVPMPDGVEMFPAYLKEAGYYTANCYKEDYNIIKSDSVWDDSSKKATWRDRKEGQPFFFMFNIMTTHESRMHFTEEQYKTIKTKTNPEDCFVQPNHPHTDLFKYSNAWYRDKITQMDSEVGDVVGELEKDGLLENTFIFYFGDHGGVLPGSKGYIFETGLHIPLVVYVPEKYQHLVHTNTGGNVDEFVNFIDFGPTVLSLAGIKTPEGMDGKPFLGKEITKESLSDRDYSFSYADRFDEKFDMVRAIRKGNFKYIRNFQPFNYDGLMNNYRYKQLGYQEWAQLYAEKDLNKVQSQFFETKDCEALYDLNNDPFETINLANDPNYKTKLVQLRSLLNKQMKGMPDLSLYPEYYLINNAFDNTVKFGQDHKEDIAKYLDVANLMYEDYDAIKNTLKAKLESKDIWERYWALNVCCKFKTEAKDLYAIASKITKADPVLINRVRAAEFLGLCKKTNPTKVITEALYQSKDANEALLIANSIVMLQDGYTNYKFNLDINKVSETVKSDKMVQWRFTYLGLL
ncbi:sulfatase family protein [Saccharicrinis aurantiacus]|uniref:sulfatase family protein n=1 Tax=Saccharicrinis aurantiacus TaxID=1849719 RepID=UPI002492F263|nr:sulfatase [Saccharicrinis aurantiacus]